MLLKMTHQNDLNIFAVTVNHCNYRTDVLNRHNCYVVIVCLSLHKGFHCNKGVEHNILESHILHFLVEIFSTIAHGSVQDKRKITVTFNIYFS